MRTRGELQDARPASKDVLDEHHVLTRDDRLEARQFLPYASAIHKRATVHIHSTARGLTGDAIPMSRGGPTWSLTIVRHILSNPIDGGRAMTFRHWQAFDHQHG